MLTNISFGYKSRRLGLLLWFITLLSIIALNGCRAHFASKRLYDDLLSDYNHLIRPVSNHSSKLVVNLSLKLTQLIEINMKQQVMSTNVWVGQVSSTLSVVIEKPTFCGRVCVARTQRLHKSIKDWQFVDERSYWRQFFHRFTKKSFVCFQTKNSSFKVE
ncbi:acetylcholine receptor subunit alpha-like 1 [Dinothrombium tinctorium]|uniref:Acetylcholine receptor subunit alpha-like 1 n=1 Tax=Dinothrombium tinctorium TaxID=1965070 RepID=A0A3S3PRW8_9ACAR|nr:acetylcholine receptor subunit alpha-like 1 [Dinothrombium tinctorium]